MYMQPRYPPYASAGFVDPAFVYNHVYAILGQHTEAKYKLEGTTVAFTGHLGNRSIFLPNVASVEWCRNLCAAVVPYATIKRIIKVGKTACIITFVSHEFARAAITDLYGRLDTLSIANMFPYFDPALYAQYGLNDTEYRIFPTWAKRKIRPKPV